MRASPDRCRPARSCVSLLGLLEWIDKAGYAAVARWSGTYAVTAYVGNVRFTRPVEVGGGATRD